MKLLKFIACLAVVITSGSTGVCQETSLPRHLTEVQATNTNVQSNAPASSQRRLTEAQVIALAKPVLPLPAGDSYRTAFKDGIWEIYTDRDGAQYRGRTVVRIRDADGEVLGMENRF